MATETTTDGVDKTQELIYYLLGVVNVLLLFRLIFKAFGANSANPLVALIYSLTNVLLVPFRGIFENASTGGSVIEPSILVAMMVYSLIARGLVELIEITMEK